MSIKMEEEIQGMHIFWNHMNENVGLASRLPFNGITKAALPAQESSACAERVFGDLGKIEGNQRQSQLTNTLEMNEIICHFVIRSVKHLAAVLKGLLPPIAVASKVVDGGRTERPNDCNKRKV